MEDLTKVTLSAYVSARGNPVPVDENVQPMRSTEIDSFHKTVNDRGAVCVILAAGQGSRFKAAYPKVIHPFAGKPMTQHAIDAAAAARIPAIVIVGHARDKVCSILQSENVAFVVQNEQMGTGHAVFVAKYALPVDFSGDVIIMYADNPSIDSALLSQLISQHDSNKEKYAEKYGAMILTGSRASAGDGANAYGRIVRASKTGGPVVDIVEKKTITHMGSGSAPPTKTYGGVVWTADELDAIDEFNSGIVVARADVYMKVLGDVVASQTKVEPPKFEYYATDFVKGMVASGIVAEGWVMPASEMWKLEGANTLEELMILEKNHTARLQEAI